MGNQTDPPDTRTDFRVKESRRTHRYDDGNYNHVQATCSNETGYAITYAHQSAHLVCVINRLLSKIILRPNKPDHRLQALQAPDMRFFFSFRNEI